MPDEENANEEAQFSDEWMIRPCQTYLEEYKDCRSIKARLHQYFIFGKSIDCTQWRRDCDDCYRWKDSRDVEAAKRIVESETARRMARLSAHYQNNVWEKRSKPPEDWDKPLPEYLQKEYENSYLNVKSKEERGEVSEAVVVETLTNMCVVM